MVSNSRHHHATSSRKNNKIGAVPIDNNTTSKDQQDDLSKLKDIFPDWSEENLSSIFLESYNDIEVAIHRISEGSQMHHILIYRTCRTVDKVNQ